MPVQTTPANPPKIKADQTTEKYNVKLPVFEGPIDLLLFLIRKKELDIHEIALSEVTREFLEYVEIIKKIDIERAGEFIVVAAILMKIKSRTLFSEEDKQEDAVLEAASNAIIEYLLEYEKLEGAALKLGEKEEERRKIFPRGGERAKVGEIVDKTPDFHLSDLMAALKDVLKAAPKRKLHEVELLNITTEMKQKEILEALGKGDRISFADLVKNQARFVIVVTFVAMLELIKKGVIGYRQASQFGRITLYRIENDKRDN
jgi:segregation and condensation protein A